MTNPNAANNLWRKTQRGVLVGLVLWIVEILILGSLTYLAHQRRLSVQTEIQEILNQQLSVEGVTAVTSYIEKNPNEAELMLSVFPNTTTLPGVIAQLEQLIAGYDPKGGVQFISNKPVKEGIELMIPMTIRMETSVSGLADFLKQMEQLPVIVEVRNVEIQLPNGQGGLIQSMIQIKLYVQDPFI